MERQYVIWLLAVSSENYHFLSLLKSPAVLLHPVPPADFPRSGTYSPPWLVGAVLHFSLKWSFSHCFVGMIF